MKSKLLLTFSLVLVLLGCREDALYQPDIALAQLSPPPPPVTASSSDPVFQLMTQGFQPGVPAQWQEVYFITYDVVRIDKVLSDTEIAMIDWTTIYNDLKLMAYKKVYTHRIVVPASEAMDPGRRLSGGWEMSVITRAGETIAVAYRKTGAFYEVSFAKFLKWK